MWTTDAHTQLQLANADHRARLATAALRRAARGERPERPLAALRRALGRSSASSPVPRRTDDDRTPWRLRPGLGHAPVARCELGC